MNGCDPQLLRLRLERKGREGRKETLSYFAPFATSAFDRDVSLTTVSAVRVEPANNFIQHNAELLDFLDRVVVHERGTHDAAGHAAEARDEPRRVHVAAAHADVARRQRLRNRGRRGAFHAEAQRWHAF